MRIVLLFLVAMVAITVSVLIVKPMALQKERFGQAGPADISHPPNSIGSTAVITAPRIAPDAKADAAR